MSKEISDERQMAFYVGTGMQIVGGLLFASTFVTSAMHFGDFTDFEARAKSEMFRALSGMALLVIGGIVRGVGARGLAGSGMILDPQRARQDLEPYSRMAGGLVKDALHEADIRLDGKSERVVMIRCGSCGKLNDEDAKFCQECGTQTGITRQS